MTKIILLTGPSGSGKSTTAREFLKKQTNTWAYVNQDEIRQLVKAGYKTADGLRSEWTKDTQKQWSASIALCVDIAERYSKFGINCIVDFYSTYDEFLSEWTKYLNSTAYNLIILMPNRETVIQRNDARDLPSKLSEVKIVECFNDFQDWDKNKTGSVIDNSNMVVGEVVSEIKKTYLI